MIQELLHRRYQADPRAAEQLFLSDILSLQPTSLSNRVGSQSNRRPDASFVDKKQPPTSEEIANSQNVQNFRPNKPLNSASNIHFPSSGGTDQAPTQTLPQSSRPSSPNRDRPFLSSPPARDSVPVQTQSTGFIKEIPEEREYENNRSPSTAVTNFAWNLFKNSNTLPNFVLSPLSPQILLSYLAYVADGQTRDELVNVNGFGNPDQIQTLVASMLSDGGGRELQIASAFFISQEMR